MDKEFIENEACKKALERVLEKIEGELVEISDKLPERAQDGLKFYNEGVMAAMNVIEEVLKVAN